MKMFAKKTGVKKITSTTIVLRFSGSVVSIVNRERRKVGRGY